MGNKRKAILLVAVSLLAVLIAGVFLVVWNPTPPPVVPMPMPNGYTAFQQAAPLVQRQTWDFTKMDQTTLRSLVDANSNALQMARSGLAEKSRVPMEFSVPHASAHMQEAERLKMVAQALLAEGRLAELDKRTNDAAQAYADATQLGVNCRQGGVLMDGFVGMAIEQMGTYALQKVAPNVDAKKSAEVSRQLERAVSDEESWPQIRANEENWSRRTFPDLRYRIAALFRWRKTRAEDAKIEKKFGAQQNSLRQLMLNLAARAYQLDKGHRPTNVSDLVPGYLKALPLDALTGKELTLKP